MQIILADAKIMFDKAGIKAETKPLFQSEADNIAAEMAVKDIAELENMLGCSHRIAAENWKRYQNFHEAKKLPAIMAYNGQAYKHLKARTLSSDDIRYAMQHLWITSFLYGMLRPLDGIVPYRATQQMGQWKELLTDTLIDSVKKDDGVLLHLSTEEYEHLFDWRRVKSEVKVVQPMFYVRKDGLLKIQAVWAKTCRGAMTRYIMEKRIADIEALQAFSYEGFEYKATLGEEDFPHFVRE